MHSIFNYFFFIASDEFSKIGKQKSNVLIAEERMCNILHGDINHSK